MAYQMSPTGNNSGSMPEGQDLERQISGRHRRGAIWLTLFQLSTIIGIVVLTALLFNIINQTFGVIAIENEIDPDQLVIRTLSQQMVEQPNTTSGEDDGALARSIAANPYAVGFFGYAYYQDLADQLRPLDVDGVAATSSAVEDGSYSLSRPLFIYSTDKNIQQKADVGGFLDFYLSNVGSEIEDVGYFAVSQERIEQSRQQLAALQVEREPDASVDLNISGSSTVYPLTLRLAERYEAETDYTGKITVDGTGTGAGYVDLCLDRTVDIANASRTISRQESSACVNKLKSAPLEFPVGIDAVAVVVSDENTFLEGASSEELQAIFLGSEKWSDVNPEWPDRPIERYIPSTASGTLDFFVGTVYKDFALDAFPKETLISVLATGISDGVMRRYEREIPFEQRSQQNVYDLVIERVIQPQVVASWNLITSIFNREEIENELLAEYPGAELQFHSWLNRHFLTNSQSSVPEQAGVRTAILGSLWVILITVLFAVPVGVGAAIYLEEYAKHGRLSQILQTNIDNLAGVPSIIYGILGLAIFVRALEPVTSGTAIGINDPTTANGRTVIAAGLTLGLLVLPLVIINSQEAIRAVPQSLRDAGYGLGATKWQVIRSHVLNSAMPGILTGTILAMSRAIGETAPLIVIGASTFITVDPTGPFSKFTVLPMQVYQWTTRPQAEFRHIAAAASIVLLVLLFMLNASAIFMRNRFSRKM